MKLIDSLSKKKQILNRPENRMEFYHGGKEFVSFISPNRRRDDGELLCASHSVNVARRYGSTITHLRLRADAAVFRMSIETFSLHPELSFDDLRDKGYLAVIVTGDLGNFDFPVDTLFILDPRAVSLERKLTKSEISRLDDGLAYKEPVAPMSRDWNLYVHCVYGGDKKEALEALAA